MKKYSKTEMLIILANMEKSTKEIAEILRLKGYDRSLYSLNYKIRLMSTKNPSRQELRRLKRSANEDIKSGTANSVT